MMVAVSCCLPGSSSNLLLLSELTSWNGIVLMEPAPLAYFGSGITHNLQYLVAGSYWIRYYSEGLIYMLVFSLLFYKL